MKTTSAILLLGAVLLVGCDDGSGVEMMPAPDAGSGGAAVTGTGGAGGDGSGGSNAGTGGAGTGGAAGAPSGSGGSGGVIGTGGSVNTGGAGGAQPGTGGSAGTGGAMGTGGTGGAPAIPMCAGTVRNAGDCFNIDQTGWKKKNGYDCNINCSTIVNGTSNVGPPTGPECVFGGNRICVASCAECQ